MQEEGTLCPIHPLQLAIVKQLLHSVELLSPTSESDSPR